MDFRKIHKKTIEYDFNSIASKPNIMIVCHPNTQKGGNMDHKIVTTICKTCTKNNIANLRFNFAGAGNSSGKYSGKTAEVENLITMINMVKDLGYDNIQLAGFSFGAYIAALVSVKLHLAMPLLVAPPINKYEFPKGLDKIRPIVIGAQNDDIVPIDAILHAFSNTNTMLYELKNTGHFLHGRLLDLANIAKKAISLKFFPKED